MNAKAILVTSGKGGVGKTTTTANVGAALARLGEKVCVIDTDVGLRNLDVVMGLEGRVVYDLIDVFEGRCKLKQALIRDKRVDSLYLLAASQTRDKSALSESRMQETVRMLIDDEEFDRVLIDSPAGIESGFQTAASAADGAVVVVNPEVSSVRDADRIIGLLEAREIGEVRLIRICGVPFALGLLLLAWAPTLQWALLALAFLAIGYGGTVPSVLGLISRASPPELQGGMLGVGQSVGSLARIVGPVLAGAALDQAMALPYLIGAGVAALGTVGALRLIQPRASVDVVAGGTGP